MWSVTGTYAQYAPSCLQPESQTQQMVQTASRMYALYDAYEGCGLAPSAGCQDTLPGPVPPAGLVQVAAGGLSAPLQPDRLKLT